MSRPHTTIRTDNGKTCTKCKRFLNFDNFSKGSDLRDGLAWYCKDCVKRKDRERYLTTNGERDRLLRLKLKGEYIEKMGGGCIRCGYSEFIAAIEFHHTEDKDNQVSILMGYAIPALNPKHLARLEQELEKCVVLCSNCHRGLHAGMWELDGPTYSKRIAFEPEYKPVEQETDYLPLFALTEYQL